MTPMFVSVIVATRNRQPLLRLTLLALLEPANHLRLGRLLGFALDGVVHGWYEMVDAITRRR